MSEPSDNVVTDVTDVIENEETKVTPNKAALDELVVIESSLRESCKIKNGLSMQDFTSVLGALRGLKKLFSDETNQSDQEDLDSYSILVQACHIQQSQGVFSFEGAERILETLKSISDSIDKVKNPKLKMKETNNKFDELKKKNINRNVGGNNNKNRGNGKK